MIDWTTLLVAIGGWAVTLIGYIIVDRREKQKQMDLFKAEIVKTLNDHRVEYLKGIEDVKDSVTDMQAVYQQNTAVIELRIQTLSDRVEKHNNVVERTYGLEKDMEVVKEKQSVANHRIEDLEKR